MLSTDLYSFSNLSIICRAASSCLDGAEAFFDAACLGVTILEPADMAVVLRNTAAAIVITAAMSCDLLIVPPAVSENLLISGCSQPLFARSRTGCRLDADKVDYSTAAGHQR